MEAFWTCSTGSNYGVGELAIFSPSWLSLYSFKNNIEKSLQLCSTDLNW